MHTDTFTRQPAFWEVEDPDIMFELLEYEKNDPQARLIYIYIYIYILLVTLSNHCMIALILIIIVILLSTILLLLFSRLDLRDVTVSSGLV